MEFGAELWMSLLSIVVIDLVLAGDNAVVIAMAARSLPLEQRKKAIFWGSFAAVAVRVLMTVLAVWLMRIPYLQALGGLVLIPVAVNLLKKDDRGGENIQEADTLLAAIKTIIVADAVMGIDNVLAIAGASHGNFLLIVAGLLISVPIVVWGSSWLSVFMNRYPILVYIGAGILGWTGGSMIVGDRLIGAALLAWAPVAKWAAPLVIAIGVIAIGRLRSAAARKDTN